MEAEASAPSSASLQHCHQAQAADVQAVMVALTPLTSGTCMSVHVNNSCVNPDDCIPLKKETSCNIQQHVQTPDRISSLPDDTLIKILSLMTVREAAMTDCLSTRWRHLWANVDHLILDPHVLGMQLQENSNNHENPNFYNSEATKFVHKVNELLSHHSGNKIKTFKVQFPLNSAHASELDRWVAFAVASYVETLVLFLGGEHVMVTTEHTEPYDFPLKHFVDARGCQLHAFSLDKCSLKTAPENLNGFSTLYSLSLNRVQVVDVVVLSIMSSCHALRYLYLSGCYILRNLRISHAQLVGIKVHRCYRLKSISIYAEKIKSFSYIGRRVHVVYECAPVLCELNVSYVNGWGPHSPLNFLGAFPELKMLSLQFPSRLQVSCVLLHNGKFAGLKEITLGVVTSWKKSIRFVALVLKAAPLVETLTVEARGNIRPLKNLKIKWTKNFTATRLRTIRIRGFSGESELLQLLFFLLRRSPVLKTLLIDTDRVRGKNRHFLDLKRSEDAMRCKFAREVAQTHLIPNVPSTAKLSIM